MPYYCIFLNNKYYRGQFEREKTIKMHTTYFKPFQIRIAVDEKIKIEPRGKIVVRGPKKIRKRETIIGTEWAMLTLRVFRLPHINIRRRGHLLIMRNCYPSKVPRRQPNWWRLFTELWCRDIDRCRFMMFWVIRQKNIKKRLAKYLVNIALGDVNSCIYCYNQCDDYKRICPKCLN